MQHPIDTGKIMKVVFSGSTTYDPVVAEEITVSLCGSLFSRVLLQYQCYVLKYAA